MKTFIFSICVLLSLTSLGQAKKTVTKTTTKPLTAPDTKKAEQLFNKFFSMNLGDTAEMNKMSELVKPICKADAQSKYCTYVAAWGKIALKKYNEAHELIEPLLRENPEWAEAYFLNGLYLSYMDDNSFIQQIQRCVELNPTLHQPIFFLASRLEDAGNFKLSLVYYNKLEQVNPKHKSLFYNRAHVKSELQDFIGSVADYTKVLENDPSHHRALFNRGHTYMLMKDYRMAEVDFTTFLKIKPDYSWAYYYRGAAKYYQNKLSESCVDMKIAVSLGNKSAEEFLPDCK